MEDFVQARQQHEHVHVGGGFAVEVAASPVACYAAEALPLCLQDTALRAARWASRCRPEAFLRDIFGPLAFRTVLLPPSVRTWQDGTVLRLATVSYEHRSLPSGHLDNARLGVLADALEEAGCDNADLLGHLRGPGPHVRGCFAVDLLLGRS
jgi:hypothetical protein